MGSEKTEFAERRQGELLPRRAREYVPPHSVPEQPDARTMENATIKLSPELDPRMQMTVLAARFVKEDRGPWRGLLIGLAVGSLLGAIVWFGPWSPALGLRAAADADEHVVGRAWDSLERVGGVTSSGPTPTVVEELDESAEAAASTDLHEQTRDPGAAGTSGSRVTGARVAVATPRAAGRPSVKASQPTTSTGGRGAKPTRAPEPRQANEAAGAPSNPPQGDEAPSQNRVWLAPKERKVWLE